MAYASKYCPNCGREHSPDTKFCSNCGNPLSDAATNANTTSDENKGLWNSVIKTANHFVGESDDTINLRLSDLVSNVFKKHTKEEQDEIFICGTKYTTPSESDIASSWPKPWLYSRVLIMLTVTLGLLLLIWNAFENWNVIPGIIFVGALAVPFSILIFFFEVNAPRNITLAETVKIFFVGGVLSLFAALVLFLFDPSETMNFFGACCVGIIEEVGKFAIVLLFCRNAKTKYILNGMLIGAAVGAGFAVFETAGYIFRTLWNTKNWASMMDVLWLRAYLSLGGHVIWAAITGAAYLFVKQDKPFEWAQLKDARFVKLFFVPVVLHAIWDMPINFLSEINFVQILMTVIGWVFVLVLINKGLKQVANLKPNESEAPVEAEIAE